MLDMTSEPAGALKLKKADSAAGLTATSPPQLPPSPRTPMEAFDAEEEPHDIDQRIEVDSWDGDSAYGDDLSSYTASVTSSVMTHSYEYGRRYHAYKDSDYLRPNDETEVDRLDMMHHIFKLLGGDKLYQSPLPKNIQRALDIGCGTGLWTMEFGEEFPSAEVLGVDLMPIQPTLVPPNVKFVIDDVEEDFPISPPYDFIHCRYMAYAIKDWKRLVQQIYDNTAPGGYAEFLDYDMTHHCEDGSNQGTYVKRWNERLWQTGYKIGRDPCPGLIVEDLAREAGFTNLVHKIYKMPIGPWPSNKRLKAIGAYHLMALLQGCEGFSLRLYIQILGWSHEEVQVLLARVRKDLNDRSIHAYMQIHVVYGQKPEASKEG